MTQALLISTWIVIQIAEILQSENVNCQWYVYDKFF